eukprot:GEMP01093605.1.p1 GENE.GEMP01093605.1~~GEMP01093605.1.p1  ORF type:complete len:115 (+),score=12.62 GEMP01093605.1:279-623(+)
MVGLVCVCVCFSFPSTLCTCLHIYIPICVCRVCAQPLPRVSRGARVRAQPVFLSSAMRAPFCFCVFVCLSVRILFRAVLCVSILPRALLCACAKNILLFVHERPRKMEGVAERE